ncbi:hypothetical protein FGG01_00490, partial [Xylella fastidiosa subsp. multiplex]|nr:hypothetical protein [Xylella fastidiosa subsp. multiplex]
MHWLLLLLAIAAMGVAFFIPQMWMLLVTLFGALGLLLFWMCVQYSKEYGKKVICIARVSCRPNPVLSCYLCWAVLVWFLSAIT